LEHSPAFFGWRPEKQSADNFVETKLKGYIPLNQLVLGHEFIYYTESLSLSTLIQGPLVANAQKTLEEWIDRLTPQDDITGQYGTIS